MVVLAMTAAEPVSVAVLVGHDDIGKVGVPVAAVECLDLEFGEALGCRCCGNI